MKNYTRYTMLAIDIGASSGRVMKVIYDNEKLSYEEIHRFKNFIHNIDESYFWDHEYIFNEIEKGINKAGDFNSLGIDTWGVDYVLYNDDKIKYSYSYRDNRSFKFYKQANHRELFFKTGVTSLPFNTSFQLLAEEKSGKFLMIPDYYTYLLTGKFSNEYTNMKTTQLDLSSLRDYNHDFQNITSLKVFDYLKDNQKKIVQVASHDTASAFIGSPYFEDAIIISFGTWSVIGAITNQPIISDEAFTNGFSNEGSIENRNRIVKNSMGSWIIEQVLSYFNFDGNYETLIQEVELLGELETFDVDNEDFINPKCMKTAIDKYLSRTDYNMYQYAKIIYDSMINSYVEIIVQLENVVLKKYQVINIVGGGSQNTYISKQIKKRLNKQVYIGPVESTVIGNCICQMIALNIIDKTKIKQIIFNSELVKEAL